MFQVKLPLQINPARLAKSGQILEGTISLETMPRIQDAFGRNTGLVNASLHFGTDDSGRDFISGHITTSIELHCHRCLEKFLLPLEIDLSLSPIANDEEAKELPGNYEPLLVSEENVSMASMLEEE